MTKSGLIGLLAEVSRTLCRDLWSDLGLGKRTEHGARGGWKLIDQIPWARPLPALGHQILEGRQDARGIALTVV